LGLISARPFGLARSPGRVMTAAGE
jgi:hypothetical protein